ncbi:MAG TPA: hypothetical protein VHE53_02765 [Patescibacteria group bacterium]|nr:hypothetical protein [Patescibacteria group bacterium]
MKQTNYSNVHEGAVSRNNQELAASSKRQMDKYQEARNVISEVDNLKLIRYGGRKMKIEGSIEGHELSVSTWMSSNHFRFDGSAGKLTRRFGGVYDGKELNTKQAYAFFSRYLYVLKRINSRLAIVRRDEENDRRIENRIKNQL